MECFMRNIAFDARVEDVRLAISNALHGGDFAQFGAEPINFDFQMHRNRKGGGRSHGGTGTLTLPQEEMGEEFIQRYGDGRMLVNGRSIFVTKSNKQLRQDIVERLRRTKYRDPQSEAEKRLAERAKQLSAKVPLSQIEQGWLKRNSDSEFASEYAIGPGGTIKELWLHFDDTNRNIVLTLTTDQDPEAEAYHIRFRYSDIDNIIFDHHTDNNKLLFRLRTPVSYEATVSLGAQFSNIDLSSASERRPSRQRHSFLPFSREHPKLAKYISSNVLVHLSKAAAKNFEKLAELARVPHIRKKRIQLSNHSAFGPETIDQLQRWIQKHKWEVAFQLQKILSNGLLNPEEYISIIPTIDELVRTSRTEHVIRVLLDFVSRLDILNKTIAKERAEGEEEEATVLECLRNALQRPTRPTLTSRLRTSRKKGVDGDFPCLHVTVTPTRIALDGPNPEQLNRVLRMYPDHWDHFLRVRFADEEQSSLRADPDVDLPRFVRSRVGGVLKEGLKVAGRHFEYLAYSSSALKGHTVWFVRPFDHPEHGRQDAQSIITRLGNFSRDGHYPARMGARIAQAFSSTDLSISVRVEEIHRILDVERNGSLFTDGVGKISPEVAKMIWRSLTKLRKRRSYFLPAAYQVRLGGYKGMLAIDHRLDGSIICVRESMNKFTSPSLDIEVARAFDRPGRCFLNRPLIMILETANKVQTDIFLVLQNRAVKETQESMRYFHTAADLLEMHGLGTSFKLPSLFTRLQHIGIELAYCNTLGIKTILKDAETDILRELKHRARIPVPECWKLVGIADEFQFLEAGQIYACVRDKDQEPIYLEGPYLITRSPAIHPGDVQVVRAIGKPPQGSPFDIEPLPNTVVFSCKGERSLASCLGGGDLDGDLYDLINLTAWPELAPRELVEPAAYPPASKKCIEDRPCTIDDVKDFICDFITSDMVGIISVQHLKLADFRAKGVCDPDCLKLAQLHSKAVDFPKSGTPVAPSEIPRSGRMPRPDWDAGELGFRSTRDEVYPSQRALGQLYRAIRLPGEQLSHQGTHPNTRFGTDLDPETHAHPLPRSRYDHISYYLRGSLARYINVDEVPHDYFVESVALLGEYIGELTRICSTYSLSSRSIISEEEVVAGTILEPTSQRRRRQDMISEMRTASAALVANFRDMLRGEDTGESEVEDWMLRSWAAYQVARASDEFGRKSFGLLALGNAFEAIESVTQRDLVR